MVVIDAIALGVPFRYITYLVAYDLTSIILLALADELAFQRTSATWDIGAGNKGEDLQVRKATQFIVSPGDPVLALG